MQNIGKVHLSKGDITAFNTDAIVNAANNTLLGGGSVDGAIHQGAGPELLKECKTLHGCKTGSAKITKAYCLPARFIIHTVGPIWQGGGHNEAELLASCYKECFRLVKDNNLTSIAFPAISCGVYGFPIEQGAEIAIQRANQFILSLPSFKAVHFVLFSQDDLTSYEKTLKSMI